MRPRPLHPLTLCLTTRALDTPPKFYLKQLVEKDPLVVEMRSHETELHKARFFLRKMYKEILQNTCFGAQGLKPDNVLRNRFPSKLL